MPAEREERPKRVPGHPVLPPALVDLQRWSLRARQSAKGRLMKTPDEIDSNCIAEAARVQMEQRTSARRTPASAQMLKVVWGAWHKLPSDLSPEEKKGLLMGNLPEREGDYFPAGFGKRVAQFARDYTRTIEVAENWARMIERLRSAEEGLVRRTEHQLRWDRPVLQDIDRIALLRTAKELRVTHKGLIERPSPSLEDINLIQYRHREYVDARQLGIERVRRLLDKMIRPGSPVPYERRAPAAWTERNDVLKGYMIAAMRALGLCPDDEWGKFEEDELPGLNGNERRKFEAIHRKRALCSNSVEVFRLWLIDNAPLIRRHDLRPGELWEHASKLGMQVPSSSDNAVKSISEWGCGFRFRKGQRKAELERQAPAILDLLSPLPRLRVA